jgi:hypothetical protein
MPRRTTGRRRPRAGRADGRPGACPRSTGRASWRTPVRHRRCARPPARARRRPRQQCHQAAADAPRPAARRPGGRTSGVRRRTRTTAPGARSGRARPRIHDPARSCAARRAGASCRCPPGPRSRTRCRARRGRRAASPAGPRSLRRVPASSSATRNRVTPPGAVTAYEAHTRLWLVVAVMPTAPAGLERSLWVATRPKLTGVRWLMHRRGRGLAGSPETTATGSAADWTIRNPKAPNGAWAEKCGVPPCFVPGRRSGTCVA